MPESTFVQLGATSYYKSDSFSTQITFNKIILATNSEQDGEYLLKVTSNNQLASCVLSSCKFSFLTSITPIIDSITPSSVTDSTQITITGSNSLLASVISI